MCGSGMAVTVSESSENVPASDSKRSTVPLVITDELRTVVPGALGVPKRAVEIATGEHGGRKLVRVRGLTAEAVRRRLADASRAR